MNDMDDRAAARLVVALAELNAEIVRLDAQPLLSVAAGQAMLEAGAEADLIRAVRATSTHLSRLVASLGDA